MKVKNLTRRMKDFAIKRKLDPDEWGYIMNTPELFVIVNKNTNEKKEYDKSLYPNTYF
jgi:hypothetical protein